LDFDKMQDHFLGGDGGLPPNMTEYLAYKKWMTEGGKIANLMPGIQLLPGDSGPQLLPGVNTPRIPTKVGFSEGFNRRIHDMHQIELPKAKPQPAPYGVPTAKWDYENPMENNNSCNSAELLIQIQGIPGIVCVPRCADVACNWPTPPTMNNVTVHQECALEASDGSSFCALICNPYRDGCPAKASCQKIFGTADGICTYDI